MSGRVFFDTNVLVYLFDASEPEKRRIVRERFERDGLAGNVVLSTQVLQEFYVIVTRKLIPALDSVKAYRAVQDLCLLPVVHIDPAMVLSAILRSRATQLSFWDSLIVEAARQGKCDVLLSEDLQTDQDIDGVRVENPFGGTAST